MRKLSLASVLVTLFSTVSLYAAQEPVLRDLHRQEIYQLTKQGHNPIDNYGETRKILMGKIHLEKDEKGYYVEDVYCNHIYRRNVGPNQIPPHDEINVEHTWPQSRFNSSESKSAQKTDLHHLFPTDSRVNGVRGNHIFGEVDGGAPTKNCQESEIGSLGGETAFMPPKEHRGNVARALFYFAVRYNLTITEKEEAALRQWHQEDPVDIDEQIRHELIYQIQGNRNPFIDNPELVYSIKNF